MAFQYAHHRPLTPITPIHSPHPSAGSSVRARTPGQLSLHEYRKMQVTPSPPAIPGQKTVKKKRGMSSLSRSEGSHAQSPRSHFFSSFASLTTPPETPSLEPPLGFTSNVLPVDAPTVSRTHQDFAGATYSEFAHLLSLGSELQHSPPQNSPSLPSLSSASRPLQSTSPYQPTTPQDTADFGLPSSRPLKHPLLGSQRSLRRPWSSAESQDHRYVPLHSEVPARPRSHQQSRVDSKRAPGNTSKETLGLETFQRPNILGSRPPGTLDRETLTDFGHQRNTWSSQNKFVKEPTRASQVATRSSQTELELTNRSENSSAPVRPRERHFNSIKRLPKPLSTNKRRPAPLRLATSNTERFYQSDDYTTSTSTFSLSKYPFPHPPQQQPLLPESPQASPPVTAKAKHNVLHLPAESPLIRFSGISFEIVNPHSSLELAEFDTGSDEVEDSQHLSSQLIDYDSDESEMGSKDSKKLPLAKRFSSFQNAYESVTHREPSSGSHSRRSSSAPRSHPATPVTPARPSTAPADITPRNTPPWVGFDENGQRVNAAGEVVTGSIQAGPGTSQADLTRARSLSATRSPDIFQRSLQYPAEPAYTSNVPLPNQLQSGDQNLSGSASSTSPIQIPSLLPSFQHDIVSPQEGRVGVVRSDTIHHSLQQAHTSGSRLITIEDTENAPANFSLPLRPRLTQNELPEPIPRLPSVGLEPPERFDPGENRSVIPSTAPRESSPLRQTLYESDFESHSIAGDDTNVPAGRAAGETRYSLATSFDDYYADSTYRRSEPFQYEHYASRGTGQSSTISRFIQEYDYKSEVASEVGNYQEEAMPLPSRLEPSSTHTTLEAPLASGQLAPVTNGSTAINGHMNGHDTTQSLAMALRASYPRLRGIIIREMAVEDFETADDFDEAIEDMEHQPLFHQHDSDYLERYHALMDRIEQVRGLDARQAAERRLNSVVPAPRSAFHRSEPRPEDYDEQDELYRSLQLGHHYLHDFQPALPEGEIETEDYHRPGDMYHRQYSSRFRSSREFYRFLDENDGDDTSIEQYEGQTPQSPLDDDPLATCNGLLGPVHATHGDSQDQHDSRGTGQDLNEVGRLLGNGSSSGGLRYGRSGPPPRGPPPGPSGNSEFAGLATIPPLNFAVRNPFEQSEVSSYDNTGKLLGLSATAPMLSGRKGAMGPASTSKIGAISKSPTLPYGLYKDCRTLNTSARIPKLWSNHSPPGSSSLKHKSEASCMASSSPSQTSDEVAAALEDGDEWETDITRSNHNSTMADYWSFPELLRKYGRSNASYIPARLVRPRDSHLPGFYPAEDLSPEPHDDFEDITVPPKAVIRQGHKTESTKSLVRFEPKTEISMTPTRHGHSLADIELGVLSPQGNPSVHSNRSSRSATTSRWQRSSVLHQNSMRPLLLGSRAHIFDKPPTLHKRIDEMTPNEVKLAHAINWFCVTFGAIIPLPSFLFCIGTFDNYTKGLTSRKMKRIAKVETAVFFSIILIVATVYLTLSHQDELRASGRS